MTVRDLRAHAQGHGEVAGLGQRRLIVGDPPENVQSYGLIGRPTLVDGQCHGAPCRRLGIGLATCVSVDVGEGREPRGVVRPLLDALAVRGAFFEVRDPFGRPACQSVGVAQAHRDGREPVVDVVYATDLESRFENLYRFVRGAEAEVYLPEHAGAPSLTELALAHPEDLETPPREREGLAELSKIDEDPR